jgi:hypothetical protein
MKLAFTQTRIIATQDDITYFDVIVGQKLSTETENDLNELKKKVFCTRDLALITAFVEKFASTDLLKTKTTPYSDEFKKEMEVLRNGLEGTPNQKSMFKKMFLNDITDVQSLLSNIQNIEDLFDINIKAQINNDKRYSKLMPLQKQLVQIQDTTNNIQTLFIELEKACKLTSDVLRRNPKSLSVDQNDKLSSLMYSIYTLAYS